MASYVEGTSGSMPRTKSLAGVVLAVVCLSAVAACGGDSGNEGGTEDTPAADSTGGSPSDAGTGTPDAEVDFSGAILFAQESTELHLIDPAEIDNLHEPAAVINTPDTTSGDWQRSSFSEDWEYAVAGSEGWFSVSRFDPAAGQYVEMFIIEPGDSSYSAEGEEFASATFSPTGTTLWLEKTTEDEEATVLWSVELTDHSTLDDIVESDFSVPVPPEYSYDDDPVWQFDSAGNPMVIPENRTVIGWIDENDGEDAEPGEWTAGYDVDESGGVVSPTVRSWGESGPGAEYEPIRRLGPTEFVMAATDGTGAGATTTGVVSRVTIDPVAEDVTFEPLVPLGAEGSLLSWAAISPDLDGALICTEADDAYYADLAAGGEPQDRGTCPMQTTAFGWK